MVLSRCLLLARKRRSGVGMLMHCPQIAMKFTKISLRRSRRRMRWHFGKNRSRVAPPGRCRQPRHDGVRAIMQNA